MEAEQNHRKISCLTLTLVRPQTSVPPSLPQPSIYNFLLLYFTHDLWGDDITVDKSSNQTTWTLSVERGQQKKERPLCLCLCVCVYTHCFVSMGNHSQTQSACDSFFHVSGLPQHIITLETIIVKSISFSHAVAWGGVAYCFDAAQGARNGT